MEVYTPVKKGSTIRHINRKAKTLLTILLIIIFAISFYVSIPKGDPATTKLKDGVTPINTPSITPDPTADPTVFPRTPKPTVSSNPNALPTPTPIPKPIGIIESAQSIDQSIWRNIASKAWGYFQPGFGIHETTGLIGLEGGFTDWDLGVYTQATIDAANLSLIKIEGEWGFNYRIDKILTFLENRELNNASYPFWFYRSDGGVHSISDLAKNPVDCVDTGRLFVALNNLKAFNASQWSSRVNSFVYNLNGNRSDYAKLIPQVEEDSLTSLSIYSYYVASGFASFWPQELSNAPNRVLDNIFANGVVTINGTSIHKAAITGDPLFCSYFEVGTSDPRLKKLVNETYLLHEAYFNETGSYRAFSEGPTMSSDWVWEWVVLPDGRVWVPLNGMDEPVTSPPIVYTKIALSFLSVYNSTFAHNLSIYLEKKMPDPANGYYEGVDEEGNCLEVIGNNSNGLILGAARYALYH
jgi:hypothetical protein